VISAQKSIFSFDTYTLDLHATRFRFSSLYFVSPFHLCSGAIATGQPLPSQLYAGGSRALHQVDRVVHHFRIASMLWMESHSHCGIWRHGIASGDPPHQGGGQHHRED
jgi:hypothetical protein